MNAAVNAMLLAVSFSAYALFIRLAREMENQMELQLTNQSLAFQIRQMAEAVCFVKEHNIGTYDELVEKADTATARLSALSGSIKSAEQRLAEIAALKKHIINYSRTKETYAAYKKSGCSKKFLEEHREEITLPKRQSQYSISLTALAAREGQIQNSHDQAAQPGVRPGAEWEESSLCGVP